MQRRADEHRREMEERGYTVFEGVLAPGELAEAEAALDALIGPETRPPVINGDANHRNGRKQLNTKYCEPRLAHLGTHPRLLGAAAALLGADVRLTRSPIPCVTFKSPPGAENFGLGYHVDWPATPPREGDETNINGVLHLSTVEPGGGAFMLFPGSHNVVTRALADPAWRERMFKQDFRGFPGLGEPIEACVPAGSVLFYHAFLVHDRSENTREQPRKIVFVHYRPWRDGERARLDPAELGASFHPDHLASMDQRVRRLCGLA